MLSPARIVRSGAASASTSKYLREGGGGGLSFVRETRRASAFDSYGAGSHCFAHEPHATRPSALAFDGSGAYAQSLAFA